MIDTDLLERAESALQLVGSDPKAALLEADAILGAIRPHESPSIAATAQRAAGLALRELGDLSQAEVRMRAGVRVSTGRAPKEQAEARMSLALVLLDRGRTRAALTQAGQAAEALTGRDGARLLAQRGLVLQRCGQFDQALEAYARALPVLRRAGDLVWEGHLLNNRGLLNAYRGSLPQARRDLERARSLWAGPGFSLRVAYADGNLGFVAALDGDVPEALARYDSVEAFYVSEGVPVGRILLDRAAVLLQAGLQEEAREVTTRAVEDLRDSGADVDVAEGLVALAQVALSQGDMSAASEVAHAAERMTRRQHRPTWTLLAREVSFTAEVASLDPQQAWRRGAQLARKLRAAGWREEEQEVLLLASQAAIAAGDLPQAQTLLEKAAAIRHGRSSVLRHRVWYGRALLRQALGQRPAALRAVVSGLTSLDQQRALLGATELRTQVAGQARELAALGLRLAAGEGRPARLLAIAELSRAGALRVRPVRPPRDVELARALSELRRASTVRLAARMDDVPAKGARRETEAAEHQVRQLSRRVPGLLGAVATPVPPVAEIVEMLGARALAEYVVIGGDLHLITAVDGWLRHHVLGPVAAVAVEVETLRFALQRVTGSATGRMAAAHDGAVQRLQDLLLAPAPELASRELVVSPAGILQGLPWSTLPALRGVPVSVAPSLTLWCRGAAADVLPATSVALASGPGLIAAQEELLASARCWPASELLVGDQATVAATLTALEGSSIAHIAAHGRLRTDNPLFSSLEMSDGPLTVYDLERLERVPSLVLLPACRSAVSTVRSGDELLGLAAAFLALGAQAVVAAVIPVPDSATASFMPRVHEQLARGLRPAEALATAIAETEDPWVRATASSFLCLGSG